MGFESWNPKPLCIYVPAPYQHDHEALTEDILF